MANEYYLKAVKSGKKDYLLRTHRKQRPTLAVLDDILEGKSNCKEIPLGLVQIPTDLIVGTKTAGRSNSFAGNFMPILDAGTEFATKWSLLSESHLEEGIHTPIKAYEYMNKFYVLEGNKRVSVLKFFGAVQIPGEVTRILPPRTKKKKNRIYYEFLDFYEHAPINYIWFSKEGSFAKLQKAVGKEPDEDWTDDDLLKFSSVYTRFTNEYEANGGGKLDITPGDALLSFISLHGFDAVDGKTTKELKELVAASWEEFQLLEEKEKVDFKMKPNLDKKPLLTRLLPLSTTKIKAAFIYEKTPGTSEWTYAHELGRFHLEQTFSSEVATVCYENGTEENVDSLIKDAIDSKCNLIFTTSPLFVQASVKAAIENPDVRILNCSFHTSHRYIRTYYPRMHEAKFLMGVIAGIMAENSLLTYIADSSSAYSIIGINAFALGVKMNNPRAKIYLEWSDQNQEELQRKIIETGSSCISWKDMIVPEENSRLFGLFHMEEGGYPRNLAMPLWHWGKLYEQLVYTIMNGTWKADDSAAAVKAINYWWGMSEGIVDVLYSSWIPGETQRMIDILKTAVSSDIFNPYEWMEENMEMGQLADNVIGEIPNEDTGVSG